MATTRWGILGAGKICHDFVKSFSEYAANKQNNKIVAVAARDIERAREFATKHKIDKVYGSYEDLAKDPEIDVIYMGNMHTHHLQEGKMCLDNGKHLLVEKPLTMNYKDSKELIDYAKSKKLFLMEALWTRFFPAMAFIKDTISVGKIGEPMYLAASFALLVGSDRDIHDNVGYGAHYFLGVYPLQAALAIFDGKPEKVNTTAVKNKHGVVITVTYTLTFKNGGVAQLMSSLGHNSTNRLLLEGTKGKIEIPQYMWTPTEVIVNGEKHEFPLPEFNQADYNYSRSVGLFQEVPPVAHCIRQGLLECPQMPHEDTLTMAQINDQVL
ncbi:trans-1,2-dihydrobenzene-1,2-diol dehydrogenase-like [Lineus longissimus]|uniref:trans-1,2-dihydrobenzene-1,2-diol dehydrogenase-like n=1 Tax=Lineus longissimus TaxID=88925 RepID=UPI002B4D1AA0